MLSESSRRWRTVVVAAAAAAALTACGTSASGNGGGSGQESAGAKQLEGVVAQLSKAQDSYPIPAESLAGTSTMAGKTVYYVPITQQAAQFAVTGAALKDALAAVGAKLQICDGGSNPTQVSACVNQASGTGAAAIIADSIPYALAANAFDAARAKNIPVVISDQIADPAHPADKTLTYVEGAGRKMLQAVADWIITDSGGDAKVVINQSTDSPSTVAYVEAAQQEFSAHCPDCEVVLNKISSANYSLISSSTSSALLRTPGVGYLVSEFEQYLQPTLGGAQQSGKISSLKGASTAAQISGLQMLGAKNFLGADVGQASAFQGWVVADAAMRLVLGRTPPAYDIPIRIFTRDSVASLPVSAAAEASGEWYGPADFPARFKSLWGVNG